MINQPPDDITDTFSDADPGLSTHKLEFCTYFQLKKFLQAHSAKSYNQYKSEFHIAERACIDQTQQHQESYKGSFAA